MEKTRKHPALDRNCRVVRCFRLRMTKDEVSVGVDDDGGVRAMPRESDTQPAGVGGERWGLTVAGERVKDNNGFTLQTLRLVRGADQHFRQIREASLHRGSLLHVRRDDGNLVRVQLNRCLGTGDQHRTIDKLADALGGGHCEQRISRARHR